jgi:transposase
MSLKVLPIPPVPEETARIVRACFPHGTLVVQLRDALGPLYSDEDVADLFPARGQPAEAPWRLAPWRLAPVTVLQFVEGLPDRRAADAVRRRLDWKHAPSLELLDPGFDRPVLSEFRTRVVAGGAEERLLALVVERARARGSARLAQGARQAAHRLDACGLRRARADPAGVCGRDAAPCAQRAGRGGARLAASTRAARVGRALRAPRRGVSPARRRQGRAGTVCQPGGCGWVALARRPRRPRRPRHPGLAARPAGGADAASGVGAAIPPTRTTRASRAAGDAGILQQAE